MGPTYFGIAFWRIRQKSLPEAEDTVKVATIVGVTDIKQVYEDWEEKYHSVIKELCPRDSCRNLFGLIRLGGND